MKKLLTLLVICALGAGAAGYAHYRHWVDIPVSQLPRQELPPSAPKPQPPQFVSSLIGQGKALYAKAKGLFGAESKTARRGGRKKPPIPVVATLAAQRDVPVTIDAVGTIQALNTVTVRPEVEGRLIEITFREGQEVKAGDILARIDPRSYKAQLDQAMAKKAQNEAELANARIDLTRYERLAKTNFGSRQRADTQRAKVAQLEAQLKVDQALIDAAKTTLDRTVIRAPIAGRTGLRKVDVGNTVRTGDTSGIVTITQVHPIALMFSLPQQHLFDLRTALRNGKVPVQALAADNKTLVDTGHVEVIDNQVEATTGTVKVKARFDNKDLKLWPGQFLNVRVFIGTMKGVTVIPSVAVQRGPAGPYVFVVKDGNKASQTDISVTMQDEQRAVIAKGIAPGDKIIVSGFGRLSDDATVAPRMRDEVTPPPAARQKSKDAATPASTRG